MDESNMSFSAEELKFCISALQLEIEDVEQEVRGPHPDSAAYIQRLGEIQDEFLVENNAFKSADLLQVYILVKKERDYLNQVLDDLNIFGEQRQEAQRHLRTANSVLRKLNKFFQSFGINISQYQ